MSSFRALNRVLHQPQPLDKVGTFGNRGRCRAATYSLHVLAGRTIRPSVARAAALQLLVCGRPQAKLNSLQTLRLSSARESCGSVDPLQRLRHAQVLLDKILCIP